MTTRLRGSSSESFHVSDWRRHGYVLWMESALWTMQSDGCVFCGLRGTQFTVTSIPIHIWTQKEGFSWIGWYSATFWSTIHFLLLSPCTFLLVPWHGILLVPRGPGGIFTATQAKTADDKLLQGGVYSLACFYSNSGQLFWSLTLKAQSVVDHYLAGMIASSLHPWFAQFGREIAIKGTRLQLSPRSYRSRNVSMFFRTSRHEISSSRADKAAWAFRAIHPDDAQLRHQILAEFDVLSVWFTR